MAVPIQTTLVPPLRLIFFMWLVFYVQEYTGMDLGFLGILPRHTSGLPGLLAAPLIHGNWQHLASNTLPILFLGSALFLFYPRIASRVFLYCYLITNILVWLFGRSFYHIGASGLVYSLAFFLLFFGLFRRDLKSLFIAIMVTVVYGSLLYRVLSIDPSISWESHLLGALTGVGVAYAQNRTYR